MLKRIAASHWVDCALGTVRSTLGAFWTIFPYFAESWGVDSSAGAWTVEALFTRYAVGLARDWLELTSRTYTFNSLDTFVALLT